MGFDESEEGAEKDSELSLIHILSLEEALSMEPMEIPDLEACLLYTS